MKLKCLECKKTFKTNKSYVQAIIHCPKYSCGLKFGTGDKDKK